MSSTGLTTPHLQTTRSGNGAGHSHAGLSSERFGRFAICLIPTYTYMYSLPTFTAMTDKRNATTPSFQSRHVDTYQINGAPFLHTAILLPARPTGSADCMTLIRGRTRSAAGLIFVGVCPEVPIDVHALTLRLASCTCQRLGAYHSCIESTVADLSQASRDGEAEFSRVFCDLLKF